MTTKRIIINAAQMEVAKRLGITPQAFVEAMAVQMDEVEEIDKDNPNNVEFYNTPIKTLRDLWLTRFGMSWVNTDELDQDLAWEIVLNRLRDYDMLESDATSTWSKLKEEV